MHLLLFLYRDSFNKLFDAARNAVMAYLDSEQTRWGQLRRELPQPFDERFRQIIDTLHISYFYRDEYPRDRFVSTIEIQKADEEFEHWRDLVRQFVDDLEQAVKKRV